MSTTCARISEIACGSCIDCSSANIYGTKLLKSRAALMGQWGSAHLASDDLNFSCASRAARASSSSYRLQLYHELPWGSHDPRQTQQKSCLQCWFLQTYKDKQICLHRQINVDFMSNSPCDCNRRLSQLWHCTLDILLYWQRSNWTSQSHHHISWSICVTGDTGQDRATALHTRNKRRVHICTQLVEHRRTAPSRRSCNRPRDTNEASDCTRQSCLLSAVGTWFGRVALSASSWPSHRPPKYHSHERRMLWTCKDPPPWSSLWGTRSNMPCKSDDHIEGPSCSCTDIWGSKCRNLPSSKRGRSKMQKTSVNEMWDWGKFPRMRKLFSGSDSEKRTRTNFSPHTRTNTHECCATSPDVCEGRWHQAQRSNHCSVITFESLFGLT